MRSVILVVALMSSGCLAYENPVQPAYVPPSTTAPYTLTIGSLPTAAGTQAIVNARVQNVNGAPLAGIPVMFAATNGTLSNDSAITSALGMASTTWTGTSADVAATTGNLNAHTIVVSNPTATPTPTLALAFLNVSGSATTGVPVTFNVSSSAMGQVWQWSFGDGAIDQSSAFSISHRYTRAGLYTANVASSGTVAASATINVTDPPPTPAPPAAFVAAVTCSTTDATTHSVGCNVSAAFNGSPVASGAMTVSWDWGDGKAGSGVSASHQYPQAGTFTVIATVTSGAQNATAAKSVVVP